MSEELREVVTLVFAQDEKLLLEQRLDEGVFKNRWTFTGGKIEEVDRLEADILLGGDGVNKRVLEAYREFRKRVSQ